MKFPVTQFKVLKKQYPNHSSLILFGRLIKGRKIPPFYLKRWMREIDKSDFAEEDFDALHGHFMKLNHAPEKWLNEATAKN